jgi:glutamate dehydrogenase (NAD(P)+)
LDVIQEAAQDKVFDRNALLEGATERDIVYAGLEEIMSTATDEVITTALSMNVDLRTAAFVNAINKIH